MLHGCAWIQSTCHPEYDGVIWTLAAAFIEEIEHVRIVCAVELEKASHPLRRVHNWHIIG